MKAVERLFERLRARFERPPLRFFRPLFDAIEAFHLWPDTTPDQPPWIRDPLDVKRYMSMVVIGLVPPLLAGVYLFGLRVLVVILVSYVVGGTIEVLFACVRREEINEGFLVTGLIFPLALPPGIPLWMVAVGVAAGVILGKEIFGGTGRNLFNPALLGRCILTVGYPEAMGRWIAPKAAWPGRLLEYAVAPASYGGAADAAADTAGSAVDAVTMATPLVEGKAALESPETFYEKAEPVANLVWGNVAGCIGETSAVAILLGAAFLLLVGVVPWRTVAGALGGFLVLGAALHAAAPATFGPVGWHLVAGGFLFGTVYMATDPVSSPITKPAKLVYGLLIGALVVLIRNLTGYVEGVTFAILLGNVAAPTLDEVVIRWRARRLEA
ncbi:MAG: RnfABCDGE type electron transport complex subunit D [Phycisphaerae bacterium]